MSVTRALKTAVEKISKGHPALGKHLASSLKTGNFCVYEPDPQVAVRWE